MVLVVPVCCTIILAYFWVWSGLGSAETRLYSVLVVVSLLLIIVLIIKFVFMGERKSTACFERSLWA